MADLRLTKKTHEELMQLDGRDYLRVVTDDEVTSLAKYQDILASERNERNVNLVMKWVVGIVSVTILVFALIQVAVVKFTVPGLGEIKAENKQLLTDIGEVVRESVSTEQKMTVEAKLDPNSAEVVQQAVRAEVEKFGLVIASNSPIVKQKDAQIIAKDREIAKLRKENRQKEADLAQVEAQKDRAVQRVAMTEKQLSEGPEMDWKRLTAKQKFAIWAAEQLGFNESTWTYDEVGPDVQVPIAWKKDRKTGKYIRDSKKKRIPIKWKTYHAYGYYQVLEPNVGPWSLRFCGVQLTPKQFLKNPECQDLVALGMIDELHDTCKGSKVRKAACVAKTWFAGPGAVSLDADDGQTTVKKYLENMTGKHALKG